VAAGGAAEVLPASLSYPLQLLRNPPSSITSLCFFVFAKMGATRKVSGQLEVIFFSSEKRVERVIYLLLAYYIILGRQRKISSSLLGG
jgi:hypothetical protein